MFEYLKGVLFFVFYLPQCELEVGLKLIEGDMDVAAMYEFVELYEKIMMSIAHVPQNLADFYYQNLSFRRRSFYDSYHQYLKPVGWMTFQRDFNDMSKVLPLKLKSMPDRPRK